MTHQYRINTSAMGMPFQVDADYFESRNGWLIFMLADRPGGTEVARFREWYVLAMATDSTEGTKP